MRKTKDIINTMENEKIILEEINIPNTNGIYIKLPGINPIIGIAKYIPYDTALHRSILAEELGHHFTTFGDLVKSKDIVYVNKLELKAKIWASNFMISDEEFIQALDSCINNKFDLCDYFNITEETLNYKLKSILSNEEKYNSLRSYFMCKEVQYETCCI